MRHAIRLALWGFPLGLLLLSALAIEAAWGQSLPYGVPGTQGLYYGYYPAPSGSAPGSWNGFFTAKQDWIGLTPLTVATLPACAAATQYHWAVVTDATTPTYLGALVGSGAVVVPVFCDGTMWTSH